MRIISPYTYPHNWLKGNFHTHTTRSDGDTSPAATISAYRDDNYDFLSITDHDLLSSSAPKRAGDMLLIPGQECHVPGGRGLFDYHIVGLGLKRAVRRRTSGQALIDAINAQGALAFVAHPRWSFMPYDLFNELSGYAGLEVYNGVCDKGFGRGFSQDFWDAYMTAHKLPLYAVAVDDTHALRRDFALGWTWVNAAKRPRSIYDALKQGNCYATTGPRFETIRVERGAITVRTTSAKAVKFVSTDGRIAGQVEGEHVKRASYTPRGTEVYIRVEVHGHDGTVAWSNPFMIEP